MDSETKLGLASKNIKHSVIELSDRIKEQDLIIEGINSETDKNSKALLQNMNKFEKIDYILNHDPRNRIILCLILLSGCLLYFLLH